MKITKKFVCIIIVAFILWSILLFVIKGMLKDNYYRHIINSQSTVILTDLRVFSDLEVVVTKYFETMRTQQYAALANMSEYEAKDKKEEQYIALATTIGLDTKEKNTPLFGKITILDTDIYACDVQLNDTKNKIVKMVIKLDIEKKYYKVLKVEVEE